VEVATQLPGDDPHAQQGGAWTAKAMARPKLGAKVKEAEGKQPGGLPFLEMGRDQASVSCGSTTPPGGPADRPSTRKNRD